MICLGILWCQSDDFYRSQILFELLNPTTKARQNIVANDDPEWEIVFTCLVELATITLVQLSKTLTIIDQNLRRRAILAMRLSPMEKPEELMGIIRLVYGYQDSLKREEFVKILCGKRCNWLLHGSLTRERMDHFLKEEVLVQMGF